MQAVVLIMRRKSMAQGLMRMLGERPELQMHYEPDYANAAVAIKSRSARAALIEVVQDGEYDAERCLELCGLLREETPGCKLILMCSEQDRDCISRVVAAKRERRIDEFVFYDTSMEYLATKFLSM